MKVERHLVLGAARSGKTRFALSMAKSLAEASGIDVIYVATAEARDVEMEARIARHREERPSHWRTVEAPRDLARALSSIERNSVVIVDCLTLWLTNALLCDFSDDAPTSLLPTWAKECEAFMSCLARAECPVILVSNEVGAGIVPMSALARRFQDEQGRLNQLVASVCERVTLVVAGIPVTIKGSAS